MPPNFDRYGFLPDYDDPYANFAASNQNSQNAASFPGAPYGHPQAHLPPQGHAHFSQQPLQGFQQHPGFQPQHPQQQLLQQQQLQIQQQQQPQPQHLPQQFAQQFSQSYPQAHAHAHAHHQPPQPPPSQQQQQQQQHFYQQNQQQFHPQVQVPQYLQTFHQPQSPVTQPQARSSPVAQFHPQQHVHRPPTHSPRTHPQSSPYSAPRPPPQRPQPSPQSVPSPLPQHVPQHLPTPATQPHVEVVIPSQIHLSSPAQPQPQPLRRPSFQSQLQQQRQSQSAPRPGSSHQLPPGPPSAQSSSYQQSPTQVHPSQLHLVQQPQKQPSPHGAQPQSANAQRLSHITIDNRKDAQSTSSPPMARSQQSSQTPQHRQTPKEQGKRPSQSQVPQQLKYPRPGALQSVDINNTQPLQQTPSKQSDGAIKTEQPDAPEPDYPTLLCALADDYLEAARKQMDLTEDYFELVSLALGCLESTLTNFKLQPLREAQLSLRYAQLLYEETENYDEAETRLTKAIEICERNKLPDLKYEMQLLLARILYESKPKAAIRESQRMIEDAEAYKHTAWLYALRLQHAMFTLAYAPPGDVHSATVQLEKVSNLAKQNSDGALLAFAAVLESLLHLSSSNQDAVTAAQTALAKARALQLNPDVEACPQMTVLMEFVDLCCSMRECTIELIEKKRGSMIETIQSAVANANWRDDGAIYIPISKRSLAGIQVHAGGHVIERNDKSFLTFHWMNKGDVEVLGYLLSAESSAHKLGPEVGKAERFADAGLQLLQGNRELTIAIGRQVSDQDRVFQKLLEAELLFVLCFIRCAKGQWPAAQETHVKIRAIADQLGHVISSNMRYAVQYLHAVILQGTGDLRGALEIYQSPMFSLSSVQDVTGTRGSGLHQLSASEYVTSETIRDYCILAAMNAIFILNHPNHPQHQQLPALREAVATALKTCQNKHIHAHHYILISATSSTQLAGKQYLSSALSAAKAIGSAPATALSLAYMYHKFYRGTMGDQALKCARAAAAQVQRWGDPLWKHATTGLYAESLEVNGYGDEAQRKKEEAEEVWHTLPDGVKAGDGT